ncbi:hypothetical protein BRD19_08905 [Halobacteriales archaeon SW_7_65_23]|nr:MAG: hypothetical protein BRD19_08905 [Halobacteriales archaeon SW_7_65_23]
MACPVCDSTDKKIINVRVPTEKDPVQFLSFNNAWDGRHMARCNGCGVLYDHRFAASEGELDGEPRGLDPSEKVNCPGCGSLNPGSRDTCSHCGEALDQSSEDRWG